VQAVVLVLIAIVLFAAGYRYYGRFLNRRFKIDDKRPTPAHTDADGVDFVPARTSVLLGHHFASIAGAGPILGPVYAAAFGWLPVFLWIIIGSLLLGGVHDFSALVASIRHGGRSIGEVIETHIGLSGKRLFLVFTWFMLILVVAVFLKAVAATFIREPSAATSSFLFIALAVLFGLAVYRWRLPLWAATITGVTLLFLCVLFGLKFPVSLSYEIWMVLLLGYIFVASVTPVWILLQPRDFLNSFLLYFMLIGGVVGLFVARPVLVFPAVTTFNTSVGPLFPMLFVTVACGAISGFHALVSSGTTAKQLSRERDALPVGYGAMLIEGLLAVLALITATMLIRSDYLSALAREGGGPIGIFSRGIGGFMAALGLPLEGAVTFSALAISAFALTSLDTATRLGRFIFQEFVGRSEAVRFKAINNRYIGTLVTVGGAALFAFSGTGDTLWPLFGASNQLLAALALLAVTVWLSQSKTQTGFLRLPMILMFCVTLAALGSLVYRNVLASNWVLSAMGLLLLAVAIVLAVQGGKALRRTT